MKNYYTIKCFCLLILLFQSIDTLAYNLRALSLTIHSSKITQNLQLNQQLQILNGAESWMVTNNSINAWEIKHLPSQKSAYLHKSSFKLADLTKGTQVLLKEFGILGFEILNSQFISNNQNSGSILKLDLKQSLTNLNLTQYLIEISSEKSSDLYTLSCPSEISTSCTHLVNSIKKVTH